MPLTQQLLIDRLHKLEENFKNNNKIGYTERNDLKLKIINNNEILGRSTENEDTVFRAVITPTIWTIRSAYKFNNERYHTNDVLRLYYLKVSSQHNFIGIKPTEIIFEDIRHEELLGSLINLKKLKSEDLLSYLSNTKIGKSLGHVCEDFYLTATEAKIYETQDNTNICIKLKHR